ncbi:MAG: hypothetical protein AAF514_18705, partial [Verrucomicrobiota bacterium]
LKENASDEERSFAFASVAERLARTGSPGVSLLLDELGWDATAVADIDSYRIGHSSSAGTRPNLNQAIRSVIESKFKTDPGAALRLVQSVPDTKIQSGLLDELVVQWAQSDPGKASQWLSNLPDSDFKVKSDLLQETIDKWAQLDGGEDGREPSIQHSDFKRRATVSLGQASATHNPEALDKILATFENAGSRLAFAEGAARVLARTDSQKALDWLGTMQAEEAGQAQRNLFEYWGKEDWQTAVKHIEVIESDRAAVTTLLDNVGGEWGNEDPVQMAAYLSSQAEPNARWCGFAAFCWMGKDPEAASQWVAELPRGPARDGAAASVSQRLIQAGKDNDYEGAVAWALDIENMEKRQEELTRVSKAWFRANPKSATAEIESLDLPKDVTHQLLHPTTPSNQ